MCLLAEAAIDLVGGLMAGLLGLTGGGLLGLISGIGAAFDDMYSFFHTGNFMDLLDTVKDIATDTWDSVKHSIEHLSDKRLKTRIAIIQKDFFGEGIHLHRYTWSREATRRYGLRGQAYGVLTQDLVAAGYGHLVALNRHGHQHILPARLLEETNLMYVSYGQSVDPVYMRLLALLAQVIEDQHKSSKELLRDKMRAAGAGGVPVTSRTAAAAPEAVPPVSLASTYTSEFSNSVPVKVYQPNPKTGQLPLCDPCAILGNHIPCVPCTDSSIQSTTSTFFGIGIKDGIDSATGKLGKTVAGQLVRLNALAENYAAPSASSSQSTQKPPGVPCVDPATLQCKTAAPLETAFGKEVGGLPFHAMNDLCKVSHLHGTCGTCMMTPSKSCKGYDIAFAALGQMLMMSGGPVGEMMMMPMILSPGTGAWMHMYVMLSSYKLMDKYFAKKLAPTRMGRYFSKSANKAAREERVNTLKRMREEGDLDNMDLENLSEQDMKALGEQMDQDLLKAAGEKTAKFGIVRADESLIWESLKVEHVPGIVKPFYNMFKRAGEKVASAVKNRIAARQAGKSAAEDAAGQGAKQEARELGGAAAESAAKDAATDATETGVASVAKKEIGDDVLKGVADSLAEDSALTVACPPCGLAALTVQMTAGILLSIYDPGGINTMMKQSQIDSIGEAFATQIGQPSEYVPSMMDTIAEKEVAMRAQAYMAADPRIKQMYDNYQLCKQKAIQDHLHNTITSSFQKLMDHVNLTWEEVNPTPPPILYREISQSSPSPSPAAVSSTSSPSPSPAAVSSTSSPSPSPAAVSSTSSPSPSPAVVSSTSLPSPSPAAVSSTSSPSPSPVVQSTRAGGLVGSTASPGTKERWWKLGPDPSGAGGGGDGPPAQPAATSPPASGSSDTKKWYQTTAFIGGASGFGVLLLILVLYYL